MSIYILWLREVKKYLRSRTQIIASLGSPIMYLGVLGFGLGPIFRKAGEGSYLQFMAPGVVGMTILFTSMFSGIALLWDRQFGFLKETLVAPVPRLWIMIGRTLGGATCRYSTGIADLRCLLHRRLSPVECCRDPARSAFYGADCCRFRCAGNGDWFQPEGHAGFSVGDELPGNADLFLSGALYPLTNLPRALALLTRIDPLTYGVDGMRTVLTGVTHFGLPADAIVLVAVAITLLTVGAWRFSKIEI